MQVISRPDTWWRCGSSVCEAHKSGAHFYSRPQSHCCLATAAASQRKGRPYGGWLMPRMAAHQLALVIIKFHTLDVCLHLCGREQGGCCSAFSSSPHTVGRVNCPIRIQSKTVKNMNSACREWSNQITLQADLLLTEASWCQSEAHREWLRNKTLCKCRLQTLIWYRCCRASRQRHRQRHHHFDL